jgi:hypothetical protein
MLINLSGLQLFAFSFTTVMNDGLFMQSTKKKSSMTIIEDF